MSILTQATVFASQAALFVSVHAYCLAYGGLMLAHAGAAWLNWRQRHIDHVTVYISCSSFYCWLFLLNMGGGH